jgi:hypothetical protein
MLSKVAIFAVAAILAAPICAATGGSGSGGGSSAGAGAGGHSGGGGGGHGGGSAAHGGAGHASARLGGRTPSTGLGTRERSELAKMGFVDAYNARIDGHDATVAVFHHAPLTATERDRLNHYHFKGFNQCAGHGGCAEQPKRGEEMYCRTARNAAITSDLECLSFRPSE